MQDSHRVSLIPGSKLTYPELWIDVYVEGDKSEQVAFAKMFIKGRCKKADTPEKADLVVFTGGPDVNPILYGEDRHSTTFFDSRRDETDIKLYEKCLNEGIPMFGVCRGAQFLHVMNGGKLYQDVDNHNGDHPIWDVTRNRLINKVSSVHHQMCIPNDEGGMKLIAQSGQARNRWKNPEELVTGPLMDVEAFFYRDTCCFGVQGHPEYAGYNQFLKWTLECLYDLVVSNPDVQVTEDRVLRLKKEFLDERDVRWRVREMGHEAN